MNILSQYKAKLCDASTAVRSVRSGDIIEYGNFMMAPDYIDKALAEHILTLKNVRLFSVCCPFVPEAVAKDTEQQHIIYCDRFFSSASRSLFDIGLCAHTPTFFHEMPGVIDEHLRTDVFILKVSPIDKHGFFSFGTSNSYQSLLAKRAGKVIVEVNANCPRCLGGYGERIHVSDVDFIVESDNTPIAEIKEEEPSEEDRLIAEHIVGRLNDGVTLQLGIGAMPNLIGKIIAGAGLKDIGVHSEMLSDAFVDMYEAGVLSGKHKTIDEGRLAYTFAMGSKRLYDFIDDNPVCASYPCDYINSPEIIAGFNNFISVNNAIEIDLFGQVCSETAGLRQISGIGGQFDFAYGASHSNGGMSFICLSSRYKNKKTQQTKPRIVPTLSNGACVSLTRHITQFVVTEYGIANLKKMNTWERAEALIALAHPDDRDDLIRQAEALKLWKPSCKRA